MIALNEIVIEKSYVGTGLITGDVFAIPLKLGKKVSLILALINTSDPASGEFRLYTSLDGINFFEFTPTPGIGIQQGTSIFNVDVIASRFIRLDQIGKGNSVTTVVQFRIE